MTIRFKFALKCIGFQIFLLICLFSSFVNAQNVLKSSKVYEFFDINCEAQRSYLDILLREIEGSEKFKGIVIIHGESNDLVTPYLQKITIANHIKFRRFDTDRIIILQGKSESRFRTELWKVPVDDLDQFVGEPWDFVISNLRLPVLFHKESWVDGIGCGQYTFNLELYSKFLAANKNLTGRIIILSKSKRNFEKAKAKLSEKLGKEDNISKNRLEFGFIQGEIEDVEYWYLPLDL